MRIYDEEVLRGKYVQCTDEKYGIIRNIYRVNTSVMDIKYTQRSPIHTKIDDIVLIIIVRNVPTLMNLTMEICCTYKWGKMLLDLMNDSLWMQVKEKVYC